MKEKRKSLLRCGIKTNNLWFTRCALYHCATSTSHSVDYLYSQLGKMLNRPKIVVPWRSNSPRATKKLFSSVETAKTHFLTQKWEMESFEDRMRSRPIEIDAIFASSLISVVKQFQSILFLTVYLFFTTYSQTVLLFLHCKRWRCQQFLCPPPNATD